ncbi:LacI family DNA-binding transcriptional regulator [Lichenicoccus sp.]|uniref:LacI family DNA-binding transcriptional regulator n=1 Tax=Lichenicoccus sp. TaxID=2781899 RepID=UPI003D0AE0CE
MKRITVHDVAAQAGVSLATVDRVLNGRRGVSEAMSQRVHSTIDRLGFTRDHFAASLATSRRHRFAFILPQPDGNSFMHALHDMVLAQNKLLMTRRIQLGVMTYPAFQATALACILESIDAQQTDGVAVVAVDAPRVRAALEQLQARGVAVITLVSDIASAGATPGRLHCIAIDNVAAGRVAGSLIGRLNARRAGRVAAIAGNLTLRDHSERHLGFSQVIGQEHRPLVLLPPAEGLDDGPATAAIVRRLLDTHADLIGLYSIGAGNRGIIAALEQSGRQHDIVVVGHELTPHTRAALLRGAFDAVLHQSVADEITVAVEALRAAADGDTGHVPAPIRIDIFMRDNV